MIQTHQLTKQFNGKGGFKNISLSVREGEIFSFLGKNGAGKSTFVRTMLGLLFHESGEATLMGKPIGTTHSRQEIGYLSELFQYPPWLTGYELLFNHGLLYHMDKDAIRKRIPEVLQITGMTGHENKKLKAYSKGMKQRIGLGCALIPNPKLLFLDEPTSALDPVGRKHVRDIILDLKKDGKTIFLNTHLLNEAEMVSDRVGIIDHGRLCKMGTMSELLITPLIIEATDLNDEVMAYLKRIDPNLKYKENQLEVLIGKDNQIPEITSFIVNQGGHIYKIAKRDNVLEELFIETVGGDDVR